MWISIEFYTLTSSDNLTNILNLKTSLIKINTKAEETGCQKDYVEGWLMHIKSQKNDDS